MVALCVESLSRVSSWRRPYETGNAYWSAFTDVHPVVRRHPVTGDEALYVNRQFTRRIVGLKKEESDAILNLLYDHIDRSGDNQTRLKWEPYTVAVWDNRVTAHVRSDTPDFTSAC